MMLDNHHSFVHDIIACFWSIHVVHLLCHCTKSVLSLNILSWLNAANLLLLLLDTLEQKRS